MHQDAPDTIATAQSIFQALTARSFRLSESAEELLCALREGGGSVLVELPWGQDRHQIVVTGLEERRVRFFNARRTEASPGTLLGEPGPERLVEANGEESMDLVRFFAVFAQGGKAMLPGG